MKSLKVQKALFNMSARLRYKLKSMLAAWQTQAKLRSHQQQADTLERRLQSQINLSEQKVRESKLIEQELEANRTLVLNLSREKDDLTKERELLKLQSGQASTDSHDQVAHRNQPEVSPTLLKSKLNLLFFIIRDSLKSRFTELRLGVKEIPVVSSTKKVNLEPSK